jgi:hypothetical protein
VNRNTIYDRYVKKTVTNKNHYSNSRVGYNGARGGPTVKPTSGQIINAQVARATAVCASASRARAPAECIS